VLQASKGGSFSVGNRKFKHKESVTPRPLPTPPSSAALEGIPTVIRGNANLRTDRISRISPLRLSMLAPATDKMVVSRSAFIGFCLTAFAGGIVLTLAVDRVHARAAEAPREPEPVVLKTIPLEPALDSPVPAAPLAATPAPAAPAPAAPAPTAPAPVAHAPAAAPAAADAVVVQLPSVEMKAPTSRPGPAPHPARKVAATTPARVVAPRKRSAPAAEGNPTETAPDEDPLLPTATKKKWTDPFAQ
jgi:hypothetical protein